MKKILIIRFSSIGDIIHTMWVSQWLKQKFPESSIHWLVRSDLQELLATDPDIDRIWAYNKKSGISGLIQLSKEVRQENFDLVYDAHQNIRSNIVRSVLFPPFSRTKTILAVRKKHPFARFARFTLGIRSAFKLPLVAVDTYIKPLEEKFGELSQETFPAKPWQFNPEFKKHDSYKKSQELLNEHPTITLIPSAAWEKKRWPVEHFKTLIKLLPNHHFIILAGPQDHFASEIASAEPDRTLNLAGETSIQESFFLVNQSQFVVSGDTGFLHAAELFKVPAVGLYGPVTMAMPYNQTTTTFYKELYCSPCSKMGEGKCVNEIYKSCLLSIEPREVAEVIKEKLPTK